MNIAVRFFASETDKPMGIPDAWPSEVIENCDIPPTLDYRIMTPNEYQDYRETHRAEYEAWAATQV